MRWTHVNFHLQNKPVENIAMHFLGNSWRYFIFLFSRCLPLNSFNWNISGKTSAVMFWIRCNRFYALTEALGLLKAFGNAGWWIECRWSQCRWPDIKSYCKIRRSSEYFEHFNLRIKNYMKEKICNLLSNSLINQTFQRK